jgi:hypothetical protein
MVAMANLRRRVELLERRKLAAQPSHSAQFDEDALSIYICLAYLNVTTDPDFHDLEPTAIYARGNELRNAIYGPIIPAYLDQHIKRYTRASGEFELAFGREPVPGDMLRDEHLQLMHGPDIYSRHFGKLIDAWKRQLPHLTCPLKFEDGRLFRRIKPEKRNEVAHWEEDDSIRSGLRWLRIPKVMSSTDSETMTIIRGLVFLGIGGAKHECRPATVEEWDQPETEKPIRDPSGFAFCQQRRCDLLVEVFGV